MLNEIVPVILEGELVDDEPLSDYQKWEAEGMRNVYPLNYSKVNVGRGWTRPRPKGFFATLFGL